jgi:hypothetical protein
MRTEIQRWLLIGTFCTTGFLMSGPALAAKDKGAAPGPSSTQEEATEARASIQLPETSFDFGEAVEGSEVMHDFAVKNTGNATLQIQQVRPG